MEIKQGTSSNVFIFVFLHFRTLFTVGRFSCLGFTALGKFLHGRDYRLHAGNQCEMAVGTRAE